MSFLREKRLLLGYLALGAPLPLPFNEVLEWPVLFLYWLLVIVFIRRAENPALKPLSNTHLNILGTLYLPVLVFDLWSALSRGQLVPTLLHMILFVLLVKLFAIRQEKDKWQILLAIFFRVRRGDGDQLPRHDRFLPAGRARRRTLGPRPLGRMAYPERAGARSSRSGQWFCRRGEGWPAPWLASCCSRCRFSSDCRGSPSRFWSAAAAWVCR